MKKKYCGMCMAVVRPAADGDCPLCGGGLDAIPRGATAGSDGDLTDACDNHPTRPATRELGSHMPNGDGTSGFHVSRRLCAECYAEHKRKHMTIEYID
jgi:hypothetical protein